MSHAAHIANVVMMSQTYLDREKEKHVAVAEEDRDQAWSDRAQALAEYQESIDYVLEEA